MININAILYKTLQGNVTIPWCRSSNNDDTQERPNIYVVQYVIKVYLPNFIRRLLKQMMERSIVSLQWEGLKSIEIEPEKYNSQIRAFKTLWAKLKQPSSRLYFIGSIKKQG